MSHLKILIFIFLSTILIQSCHYFTGTNKPTAKSGQIDLTHWDFNKNTFAELDGEWTFIWNKFVRPGNIIRDDSIYNCLVPGTWKNIKVENERLKGFGYGTYKLKVLLKPGKFVLRIPAINSSYSLFIDDSLYVSVGKPSIQKDFTLAARIPKYVYFQTQKSNAEILIFVADFEVGTGGINHTLKLFSEQAFNDSFINRYSLDLFLLGMLLIMALYHFILYIYFRNYKANLYFSLFAYAVAIYASCFSEQILNHLFPKISWVLQIKISRVSVILAVHFFILFIFHLFPINRFKKLIRILSIINILFCISILFLSVLLSSYVMIYMRIYMILLIILIMLYLVYLVFKKTENARIILAGFFFLILTALNDILNYSNFKSGGDIYIPLGLIAMVIAYSIYSSLKIANISMKISISNLQMTKLNKLKDEFIRAELTHFNSLLSILLNNMDASIAILLMMEEDKPTLVAIQQKNTTEVRDLPTVEIDLDNNNSNQIPKSFLNQAIREKKPLMISISTNSQFPDNEYFKQFSIKSAFALPIMIEDRLKAMIYFESSIKVNAFSQDDLDTLMMISSNIAISLDHIILNKSLAHRIKEATQTLNEQNIQLVINQKELNDLVATKDRLITIIGNDLRNPFQSITNGSEQLIEKFNLYSNEKKLENIRSINSWASKGFVLLNDLLEWSRCQNNDITFFPRKLALSYLINEVVGSLETNIKSKKIKVICPIEENIFVFADEKILSTILRNLISNAIKFSYEEGKVLVSASLDSAKKIVEIEVIDYGIGISDDDIQKLFRFDSYFIRKGTANEEGAGLGLILAQELARKMSTKIIVESQAGKSTRFHFQLPLSS